MRFEAQIHGTEGTRTVKLTSEYDAMSVLQGMAVEHLREDERVGWITRIAAGHATRTHAAS
jgi:hypothetical protein